MSPGRERLRPQRLNERRRIAQYPTGQPKAGIEFTLGRRSEDKSSSKIVEECSFAARSYGSNDDCACPGSEIAYGSRKGLADLPW